MFDTNPYRGRPDRAAWRQGVAAAPDAIADLAAGLPFRIAPGDRVATAGSCFAQHLARNLPAFGIEPMLTESFVAARGQRNAVFSHGAVGEVRATLAGILRHGAG